MNSLRMIHLGAGWQATPKGHKSKTTTTTSKHTHTNTRSAIKSFHY